MASPRPSRPGKGGALLPAPGAVRRRGSPSRRTGRGLARRPRRQGLAAVELAIRTAMSKLGASLLQDLLGLDTGHRGPRVDCGAGHQASFVAYRDKNLDTVLGPVTLGRAYYHCSDCGVGVMPKDNELGVAGASLSPGLRAMVARVGAAAPFAKASDLLTERAGVELPTKRVERSAEADGTTLVAIGDAEAAAVLTGRPVPLGPAKPVAKLYVATGGTGVPTVPADTAGRAGKYPDGRARTREVKLGVLFTQTSVDQDGYPVRDPGSSSYVATLQAAPHFGSLVYAEARRRGSVAAHQLIVLGDGAPWIWNLADKHFPGATQIVDLYHAREHCHALGALVAGVVGQDGSGWLAERLADLDRGDVAALVEAGRKLNLPQAQRLEVDKALGYFETNAVRMRYAHFRELGHFVGSGAVEAGCKAVIGQRLKLSGMRWSLRGAAGIATLRCQEASGRWDEVWHRLDNQTSAA